MLFKQEPVLTISFANQAFFWNPNKLQPEPTNNQNQLFFQKAL